MSLDADPTDTLDPSLITNVTHYLSPSAHSSTFFANDPVNSNNTTASTTMSGATSGLSPPTPATADGTPLETTAQGNSPQEFASPQNGGDSPAGTPATKEKQRRIRLTRAEDLALLRLCVEHAHEFYAGNKQEFWARIRELSRQTIQRDFKDPRGRVLALLKARLEEKSREGAGQENKNGKGSRARLSGSGEMVEVMRDLLDRFQERVRVVDAGPVQGRMRVWTAGGEGVEPVQENSESATGQTPQNRGRKRSFSAFVQEARDVAEPLDDGTGSSATLFQAETRTTPAIPRPHAASYLQPHAAMVTPGSGPSVMAAPSFPPETPTNLLGPSRALATNLSSLSTSIASLVQAAVNDALSGHGIHATPDGRTNTPSHPPRPIGSNVDSRLAVLERQVAETRRAVDQNGEVMRQILAALQGSAQGRRMAAQNQQQQQQRNMGGGPNGLDITMANSGDGSLNGHP